MKISAEKNISDVNERINEQKVRFEKDISLIDNNEMTQ